MKIIICSPVHCPLTQEKNWNPQSTRAWAEIRAMYICKQEAASLHSLSPHKTQQNQETSKQQHKIKMNMGRNTLHRRKKTHPTKQHNHVLKPLLTKHNINCYHQGRLRLKSSCCCCSLTVNRTKNLWFFSPTQLFTHGQWWSIFRMHRLQILQERTRSFCWEILFYMEKQGQPVGRGWCAEIFCRKGF